MKTIRNSLLLGLLIAYAVASMFSGYDTAMAFAEERDEYEVGQHCTVYDEDDHSQVVFNTGRYVSVGDEYQTADDRLYQVVRLAGEDTAYAKFVRQIGPENLSTNFSQILQEMLQAKAAPGKEVTIGIYHTHNSESYTPTDGSSSIRGNGGIYKVGDALAASLRQAGAKVIHNKAKHDPHDVGAYQRSRRTAQELLKESTAILDVHRDAVPAKLYTGEVNGEKVALVQLVVGRQNPNMAANKQFAQEIKSATDKQQPGLVKGIFFARSGYNQDLSPRSLLLEVGTDSHTRADAEKGASLFAKSYASYLGASTAGSAAGHKREGKVGTRTAFWLVGMVVVGAAIYMLVSTGSPAELKSKLHTFTTKEFGDVLGGRNRNRDSDKHEKDK